MITIVRNGVFEFLSGMPFFAFSVSLGLM